MHDLYVNGRVAQREMIPEQIVEKSVFGNTTLDSRAGGIQSFVVYGASNSSLIPRWWNQDRDNRLKQASLEVDLLSSVVNTMTMKLFNLPLKIVPKNNMIASHNKLADIYDSLMQTAWLRYGEVFINDMLTCDKGAFFVVEGTRSLSLPFKEGDVPTGIRHVSSQEILLNNQEEHPYIWMKDNGGNVKLHHSRVIRIAQMPMAVMDNVSIGFSFISRAFNVAQLMSYAVQYGLESLGAIESDQIIYGTATTSKAIKQAFKDAQVDSVNSGMLRSGKRVYMGLRDANAKLGTLNVKRLPEGFDYEKFTNTTIKLLAIAGGIDEDDIAASSSAGTTKTATLISEQKGKFKLLAWFSKKFATEIGQKFLPAALKLRVGTSEENISETKGKALINLARVAKIQAEIGITDERESRVNALKDGSITEDQFNRLELRDGRLEDGLPVRALFFSNDQVMQKLLNLPGIPEPCIIDDTDPEREIEIINKQICEVERIAVNTTSSNIHANAMQAIAALTWLLDEYEELVSIAEEELAIIENIPEPTPPERSESPQETPDEEEQEETTDTIKKSYRRPTERSMRRKQSKSRKIVKEVWQNDIDLDLDLLIEAIMDGDITDADDILKQVDELKEYVETHRKSDGELLKNVYSRLDKLLE